MDVDRKQLEEFVWLAMAAADLIDTVVDGHMIEFKTRSVPGAPVDKTLVESSAEFSMRLRNHPIVRASESNLPLQH